jgi:hypothetical protein
METAQPNRSWAAPLEGKSRCCSIHVAPERTKTWAAPALTPAGVSSKIEPTTAVSPEMETAEPNWAPVASKSPRPKSCASWTSDAGVGEAVRSAAAAPGATAIIHTMGARLAKVTRQVREGGPFVIRGDRARSILA